MRIKFLFVGLAIVASSAQGKQTYAAYEGSGAIQTGMGGTKITANGIDYWTTGRPPRRYQILGVLTDARKHGLGDGEVLGSKSVAAKTLAAGGNAVIFGDSDTRNAGSVSVATGNGGFITADESRTTTQLIVIKYLPSE